MDSVWIPHVENPQTAVFLSTSVDNVGEKPSIPSPSLSTGVDSGDDRRRDIHDGETRPYLKLHLKLLACLPPWG